MRHILPSFIVPVTKFFNIIVCIINQSFTFTAHRSGFLIFIDIDSIHTLVHSFLGLYKFFFLRFLVKCINIMNVIDRSHFGRKIFQISVGLLRKYTRSHFLIMLIRCLNMLFRLFINISLHIIEQLYFALCTNLFFLMLKRHNCRHPCCPNIILLCNDMYHILVTGNSLRLLHPLHQSTILPINTLGHLLIQPTHHHPSIVQTIKFIPKSSPRSILKILR
mmetsp:Transcript_18755/g.24348  ORF Transcript_18755/g.24348 Transcript_18755/m.24348 type:complete len:220 (+) Transcript_18755:292-951(+)